MQPAGSVPGSIPFASVEQSLLNVIYEGVIILGGTGVGKTMSSGRAIARMLLRSGAGGVVFTTKPDDLNTWVRKYAAGTGRDPRQDFVVVAPSTPHPESIWPTDLLGPRRVYRFNVLQEEYRRSGGFVRNIGDMLVAAMSHGTQVTAGTDLYWEQSLYQLLNNTLDLAARATLLSKGAAQIQLAELLAIVQSAAQSPNDLSSTRFRNGRCFQYLETVDVARDHLDDAAYGDAEMTAAYWLRGFPSLAERVRSIIVSMLTSKTDGLLRSPLRELMFGETDGEASPLNCFEPDPVTGRPKIIVVDLPIKLYGAVGRDAQILYKVAWQKEADRRAKRLEQGQGSGTTAFIWADEAHHLVTKSDALFQSTARSARVGTVYLTQNLPGMMAALGEHSTNALLGSLQTKVIHTNGDAETNYWAERTIGTAHQDGHSITVDLSGRRGMSGNYHEVREPLVPAIRFTRMRKAAPGRPSEAVLFSPGVRWGPSGHSHAFASFPPPDQDSA